MNNLYIQWAIDVLNSENFKIITPVPDVIQNTPWSQVLRFSTSQGYVFLKKVPEKLSIEATIIDILHKKFNAPVPQMISINQDQHCFLMHDAGIRLHDYFKDHFQADVLVRTIQDYITLQMTACHHIELFIDLGIPDWRLEKLPKLYKDFITHESLLLEDGLNKSELNMLKKLEPSLVSICEKLSLYSIKDTFGHADFHDKNILINPDTHQTTLIDLGEVVITHPFFSLHNCLHMAKENFVLSNETYQQLQSDCLKPWLSLDTQEHLLEILSLIQQCWSIHAVLGEFRLMNSVDPSDFKKLHREGRLAKKLRYWINQNQQ